MDLTDHPRITIDPAVMVGKPCIRGLRITVADVVEMLAAGHPRSAILKQFPLLEDADFGAALAFAADVLNDAYRPGVPRRELVAAAR
jgi:uncharacterized protein (DUF433 family)